MRQPDSHVTPYGRFVSGQTIDSSSGVLETETNCPFADQGGTSAFALRRQIAYRSGNSVKVRSALGLIATNPFFYLRRTVVFEHVQQPAWICFLDHKPAICRPQETFSNSV